MTRERNQPRHAAFVAFALVGLLFFAVAATIDRHRHHDVLIDIAAGVGAVAIAVTTLVKRGPDDEDQQQ